MKKYFVIFVLLLLQSIIFISCSKSEETNINNPPGNKQATIKYEVKFIAGGGVTVYYKKSDFSKDSVINVTANWSKEVVFTNTIDAYLEAVVTSVPPGSSTTVKLEIYKDGVNIREFQYGGGIGTKLSIEHKETLN